LSTRAFYRHFDSKDDLVAAVFLESARAEKRRLQRRMNSAATEIEAVAAWIDARLDLAFDDNIRSDLRRLSLEAQSQTFASPSLIQPAYAEMLKPLSQALARGLQRKVFHRIDPAADAQFIHGVVWSGIDREWEAGDSDRNDLRQRVVRFCLRGLGVPAEVIEQICAEN
jgi:AcrR family transcriptional regulator